MKPQHKTTLGKYYNFIGSVGKYDVYKHLQMFPRSAYNIQGPGKLHYYEATTPAIKRTFLFNPDLNQAREFCRAHYNLNQ